VVHHLPVESDGTDHGEIRQPSPTLVADLMLAATQTLLKQTDHDRADLAVGQEVAPVEEHGVAAVRDGDAVLRDQLSARHGPQLLFGIGRALR
jgi:hypothetical protein